MTDFDLYNKQVKQLAASIPRVGRLAAPDASATAHSPVCGSRITIDLKLADGVVADYAQEVRACAIGQAVASFVGQEIVGLPVAEIHNGASAFRALLKDKKLPETEPWSALEPFLPVADVRSRHGSALLPFEALERALDDIDRQNSGRQSAYAARDSAESIAG